MTTKLLVQEEPAIYKVLLEPASVQPLSKVVSKLVDGSHNPPAKRDVGYPMLSARNIDNGSINFDEFRFVSNEDFALEDRRTRVTAGDVLLTIVGTIGRAAVVPESAAPFALQRSVAVMTPTRLLPGFLAYQLQAPEVQRYFERNARGTAQKGVYLKTLGNTPVLVPNREAQRQTVAYLDEQLSRLDASVAALHRVQANLKRYRASVLKSACEGRLVPTEAELARREGSDFETGAQLLQRTLDERREKLAARGKSNEAVLAATAALAPLPDGWAWASVEQLNLAARPCAYGVLQPGKDQSDGVRLVRVGDVNDGRIDTEGIKRVDPEIAAAYPRTKLSGGEVLITLVGAIGRTAVVPASLAGANTARAVGVIPLSPLVSAHWVELWFRNPSTVDRMTAASHEVARKTLNLEDVRLAAVALPPFAEQHRIVAEADRRLSLIRVAEAQVAANLARAQRLRQSILQAAFASPAPH